MFVRIGVPVRNASHGIVRSAESGPHCTPLCFQRAETNSLFSPRSSRNGVATHACRCVSIRSLRFHAELLFILAHITHRSVQTLIISFLRRSSIKLLPSQFLKNTFFFLCTSKLFETGTLRGRMLVLKCGDDSRMSGVMKGCLKWGRGLERAHS